MSLLLFQVVLIKLQFMGLIIVLIRYYIGLKVDEIDKKIAKLELPKIMKRNARPVSQRTYFHANELRTFGNFTGEFVLDEILPPRYQINYLK